jgi:4-amino-4-deoxy-L-arabinose transferase-like glycosyltransferase
VKLPSLRLPERVGWRDHLIGACLGAVYVAWLLTTVRSVGVPRDEGIYFRAGSDYIRWWRMLFERGRDALERGAIDSCFGINHEHPSLFKTLFGASWLFFHEKWRLFEDATTAYRLPGMMSAALAIWVTYLFGARAWSRRAGLVAAVLLALMPQVFFHAHLACFDVPIMAMWIWCVYVHWRAQETRSIAWAIATGVVYGLALDTKHNAWFIPAALVPHALFVQRHAVLRALRAGRVAIPSSLVAMATIGPAVFLALWPYLWSDTMGRIQWWVDFHRHHEFYNIEFLGKNYFGPPSPRSYLPVMIVATVPTVTVLLFFAGALDRVSVAARRLRAWALGVLKRPVDAASRPARDPRETDLLLALSFAVAVGPWLLSSTPIFGGTKHWMPAYPVLALFAGRGFELVSDALRRALPSLDARRMLAAQIALGACVFVAPLAITAHAHPFGISAYVPLVGGTAGGADLGLNRQFWGYTTQNAAVEYLNANAPRGATVFIHDTTWDAWGRMQEEGRIRGDLRAVGSPHEAMYALVQHELHMSEVDYSIWVADGTDSPAYIVTQDGVPIVSVYKRQ